MKTRSQSALPTEEIKLAAKNLLRLSEMPARPRRACVKAAAQVHASGRPRRSTATPVNYAE
jgi:hypothetical protein